MIENNSVRKMKDDIPALNSPAKNSIATPSPAKRAFLHAAWRNLLMVNYAIDPSILLSYLPAHTELDYWKDTCYISLIGFLFKDTSVLGIRIPFHINFEEVNLRFYVRHKSAGVWKRGVVFIKEIVPRAALTFVANNLYGEHYATMPMRHSVIMEKEELKVEYGWKRGKTWHSMRATTESKSTLISEGSEEEFITEHYWGYTKLKGNRTSEYGVEHPRWNVHKVLNYKIDVDFAALYGSDFSFLNAAQVRSVLLADGSEIIVRGGSKLKG